MYSQFKTLTGFPHFYTDIAEVSLTARSGYMPMTFQVVEKFPRWANLVATGAG